MVIRRRLPGFCVLALLSGIGAGMAMRSAAAQPTAARQDQDGAVVSTAVRSMMTGGAGAMASYVAGLEDALRHVPKGYQKLAQMGDEIRYRADDPADFALFSAWQTERSRAAGRPPPRIVLLPNTYLTASFLLGWFYNEANQPAQALTALDRGLALAPGDGRLAGEKGQALIKLGRLDAALALYNQTLASDGFLPPKARAMLLRAKGFCLTELKQFDAAAQAYRDSLTLEPDHLGARNELAYIARVQGGGAPTAPRMTTYEKAKQGKQ